MLKAGFCVAVIGFGAMAGCSTLPALDYPTATSSQECSIEFSEDLRMAREARQSQQGATSAAEQAQLASIQSARLKACLQRVWKPIHGFAPSSVGAAVVPQYAPAWEAFEPSYTPPPRGSQYCVPGGGPFARGGTYCTGY